MSGAGRPTIASDALMDDICDKLATGMSLRAICREDGMPCRASVLRWADQDPVFATKYARAREAGVEVHVDEMIEISDNLEIPPEHKKHMLGTRQWVASKLIAKKYGTKVQQEVTGPNGSPLGPAVIVIPPDMSPSDAAKAYQDIIDRA